VASGAVLNDPHGGSGARDDHAGDHVSPQRSCAAPDALVAPGASSCTVPCSMLRECDKRDSGTGSTMGTYRSSKSSTSSPHRPPHMRHVGETWVGANMRTSAG
jgi:hypothetical protein